MIKIKNFIRLTDFNKEELFTIFQIADDIKKGEYSDYLKGKTVVLFLPSSSIRTRITFEKGIHLLGGQVILFPTESLDKKEEIKDVCGYLNNWADLVVVRHKNITILEEMADCLDVPVINAMTDVNHPCEIMSDLYALSKRRKDYIKDKYLFCGQNGNIGLAWKEAARVFGFELTQCCRKGEEIAGVESFSDIEEAIIGRDIICTDSISSEKLRDWKSCQVTLEIMEKANKGALLNPCPPFYRGEEVSEDVINSKYFVGYDFKKCLLEIQQAIIIYCLV